MVDDLLCFNIEYLRLFLLIFNFILQMYNWMKSYEMTEITKKV
jgi:hypothetical protein